MQMAYVGHFFFYNSFPLSQVISNFKQEAIPVKACEPSLLRFSSLAGIQHTLKHLLVSEVGCNQLIINIFYFTYLGIYNLPISERI